MRIPHDELAQDTLDAIIEEFVSREGTDYGGQEYDLANKVLQVRSQLERGDIILNFDPESETCNLVSAQDYRAMESNLEDMRESDETSND